MCHNIAHSIKKRKTKITIKLEEVLSINIDSRVSYSDNNSIIFMHILYIANYKKFLNQKSKLGNFKTHK